MGTAYRQLGLEERCAIARLHEDGQSFRQIAAALDRAPSTISRELKRNAGSKVGYKPAYAQEKTRARRWSGMRLERDDALREGVLGRLAAGWSPEQVAGRMAREAGKPVISHESIYRFVHAQIRRTNDGRWRHYLPRAKARRGWRGKPGGSPASFIARRKSIDMRPQDAANRATPGHWEADFMLFAHYGQNILVAHERRSRYTLIHHPPDRKAHRTAAALADMLRAWPATLRKTMTFDNGTEFAQHHKLRALGIDTFFCDPHAPWQKGGVENAIGRLRRYLPRKTNIDTLSPRLLDTIIQRYNNTPRKCLDFQTPEEACSQLPLHFKCESTSPPSRE
jgi:IS30 family transposase